MSDSIDNGAIKAAARIPAMSLQTAYRSSTAMIEPLPQKSDPAFEITISPKAQAVLDGMRSAKTEEVRADVARQGAREVAAAAGVSEAEAVQAAQPLRSPPPAKGVVLFQANMTAVIE